jgi:uncharacterized membrane protein YfcA
MELELSQWLMGAAAAALVGFSKTGVPGAGILVVPLMASIFGGRESVGTLLPMLIFADCFAVARYRQHAQWDKLWAVFPWVGAGIALGAVLLWYSGEQSGRDWMSPLIGTLVLLMLAVHLLRKALGGDAAPKSHLATVSAGVAGGFTTTVSNAAGPVMGIYLTAMGLTKEQFMGTFAWFFFTLNSAKLPIFVALTVMNPEKPLITLSSLGFNAAVSPMILLGALFGYWALPRMSQSTFDAAILGLAAIAAVRLLLIW